MIKTSAKSLPKAKTSKMDLTTKLSIFFITSIVLIILAILVGYILYKSVPIFKEFSFFKFLFSGNWAPAKDEATGASYGLGKIILSTLMMMFITLLFAIPLTIFSSLFITEYLKNRTKKFVVTVIQLLAGIPSVVFGLFALDQIGPIFVAMGAPTSGNMMTASFTLAFMALPTMISLSINAIEAVPEGHRYASLGLGMTKEKTTFGVVLVSAMPKIITAIITGVARIIGETMAVILIAGNSTKGLNTGDGFFGFIFSSIRTLAGTIGLEMLENHGNIHESALYAIGMVLFIIVIFINLLIIAVGNINNNKTKSIKNIKHKKVKSRSNNYEYESHSLNILVQTYTEKRFAKKVNSFILNFFMISSTAIIIGFTSWILLTVTFKGIGGFDPSAFIEIEGQRSGIFALIFTTILLVLATIIFAIPLALIVAIYLAEYAHKDSTFAKIIRFSINVLASTPSIVFGVFGLSLFVVAMGIPMSIFASSLTMTMVILPSMISTFEDSITSVPPLYKEAAYGMGMTKTGVLFKVILPNATKGLVTGTILAIARIIGESAPVYLTLGTAVRMPTEGFFSSGATLTTQIYMMASEGNDPHTLGVAYQIALVTIMLVLGLNFLSKYIGVKLNPVHKKIPFKVKLKIFIGMFTIAKFKKVVAKTKKDTISIYRKWVYYFNFKRMKIHFKNAKVRNKVIKTIKQEAKNKSKIKSKSKNEMRED
ncbi:phosphate ABC transporter permease PstA [Spiroplasma diminutum]|uniref:Phosphate ABC transporter permease n=1 Tax=Spiroplasma diminutum CUAS-1 TaxID=1276221 RepID=S5MF16_9MOLU|nr:phosphate ABC transporter permease PstA [Spiroplasma diminutum]AGR42378.1 phosphate ABC transporter permease [Spiroplasma diminutum CUAS-1]